MGILYSLQPPRCFQFSMALRSWYHFHRAVPDQDGHSHTRWSPSPTQSLSGGRVIPQLLMYWESNLQNTPGSCLWSDDLCEMSYIKYKFDIQPHTVKTAVSPQSCFRSKQMVTKETELFHRRTPCTRTPSIRSKYDTQLRFICKCEQNFLSFAFLSAFLGNSGTLLRMQGNSLQIDVFPAPQLYLVWVSSAKQ